MSFMPRVVPDRKVDKSLLGHMTNNKVNGLSCALGLEVGMGGGVGAGLLPGVKCGRCTSTLFIPFTLETILEEGK